MKKRTFWISFLIGLIGLGILGLLIGELRVEGQLKNWEEDNLRNFEPDQTIHQQLGNDFVLQTTAVLVGEAEEAPYNQFQSKMSSILAERVDASNGCLVLNRGDQVRYCVTLSNLSNTKREVECLIDFGPQQTLLTDEDMPAGSELSSTLADHQATIEVAIPAGGQAMFTLTTKLTSTLKASPLRARLPINATVRSEELKATGEIFCLETVSCWGRLRLSIVIMLIATLLSLVIAAAVSWL